jgi:hypothetical protein
LLPEEAATPATTPSTNIPIAIRTYLRFMISSR